MPIITCPTCGTKLEVEADQMGEQVQCGSCQQVFEAKSDRGSGRGRKSKFDRDEEEDDDRPRRRKSKYRREDDEDDDLDDDYAPRRRPSDGGTGMGVASLVLGIVSIPLGLCCGVLGGMCGGLAIIFGIISLKSPGKGMGIGGIITGAISILLAIAMIIFSVGFNLWGRGLAPGGPNPPPPAFRVK